MRAVLAALIPRISFERVLQETGRKSPSNIAALYLDGGMDAARAVLRAKVPHLDDDRHFHPDIAAAESLVLGGELVAAVGAALPGVEGGAA